MTTINGLNNCKFIGHVKDDPTIFRHESGKVIGRFQMSIHETRVSSKHPEPIELDQLIFCVAWNDLAETIEKIKRGHLVFVEGKYKSRIEEKPNITKYLSEFHLKHIIILNTNPI